MYLRLVTYLNLDAVISDEWRSYLSFSMGIIVDEVQGGDAELE